MNICTSNLDFTVLTISYTG